MRYVAIFLSVLILIPACQQRDAQSDRSLSKAGSQKKGDGRSVAANVPGTRSGKSDEASSAETENKNTVDRGIRPPEAAPEVETLEAPVFPPPQAGAMVDIPDGTFLRGSAVDDVLREQFAENDHIPTKMTALQMDVLPWPNDPAMPPLTGVSQMEAQQHCESAGKRLCTEAEWEWACRSSDNRRYISGNLF
ncbi:MAG: SUMF1/EgtB/PvdO family nonheme iron enzyme, partial [Deltaproteobacteria bacterium]|nr:SUMF1/EgtB/PvdO family nonheme iron enzyme [Deltaproteobacteria bacterium]